MSTAAAPGGLRRSGVLLPEDPGEEELARNWTLSEADQREARQCRGEENRRRFALQLCVVRRYGRLLEIEESAPVRIVNYLGAQLELPPVLFAAGPLRPVTEQQYAERVRRYLGWRTFDAAVQHELAAWVEQRTLEGFSQTEVALRAEEVLLARQVVLPRKAVFARLLQSLCRRAERQVFAGLADQLSAPFRGEIDRLLEVPESARRSSLFHLKAYPPEAKPDTILSFLDNCRYLHSIGVAQIRLAGCSVALLLQFAKTVRSEDVWHLRRLPEAKKYAVLACFLVEALKTMLDHSVEMNDQFLVGMCRRSKNSYERKQKEYRQRAHQGRQQLLSGMEIVVAEDRDPVQMYQSLYAKFPKPQLRSAMADCRESERLETHGYAGELNARISHLKRYQPRFFELPFEAQPGSAPLLDALQLARQLDSGQLKSLPKEAPVGFVAAKLRAPVRNADGDIQQRTWEIALGLAVRDHLRSGSLYLAASRKHGHFWNLVYDDARWSAEREQGYSRLALPSQTPPVFQHLEVELACAATKALEGLAANPFAKVSNGRLQLKRRDALEFMPRIKDLPDQRLFKLDRQQHYGELDCLFDQTVSRELVEEQWDQMVRLVVALKNRNAPPEVVVERLASAGSADRLAKALTAYGRIIKTIYILRYIQEEDLRQSVQLQLNRGEHRHILAKWLFFANRGEFRDGDINEIMNKTSCLSVLSNAVVIWNTIHMQKIVDRLRAAGEQVQDADLARNWPLLHAHIIPNGTYDFSAC